jgi:hypothetical protein
LIDDVDLARGKAFSWEKEFVAVFEKGGFDVVIGNPPYVVVENKNQFKKYNWNNDLYHIFFEKILKYPFLNSKAYFSFITPRFFSVNKNCTEIRDFFLNDPNTDLIELVETTPFQDAETECLISLFKKGNEVNSDSIVIKNDSNNIISSTNTISKSYCNLNKNKEILTFITREIINVLQVIEKDVVLLDEISDSRRGMEIGKRNFINEGLETLVGYDVDKYIIDFDKKYVGQYEKQYLRLSDFFQEENLIYLRRVSPILRAVVSSKKYAFNKNLYGIKIVSQYSNKYITVLLNSKLLTYYYKNKFSTKKVDLFPEIQSYLFKSLPIKKLTMTMQVTFIEQADKMLGLNKQLQVQTQKFISRIQNNIEVEKITKKISAFYNNDFSIFVKELKKQKVILTLHQQDEWEEYFNTYKVSINQLQAEIDKTDKEIDAMVYELYGLNEEEIKIVEAS